MPVFFLCWNLTSPEEWVVATLLRHDRPCVGVRYEVAAPAAPFSRSAANCAGSLVGGQQVCPAQTIATALSAERCGRVSLKAPARFASEAPGESRRTDLPKR